MGASEFINVNDDEVMRLVQKLTELTKDKRIEWHPLHHEYENFEAFTSYIFRTEAAVINPVFFAEVEGGYVYLIRLADRKDIKEKPKATAGSNYPRSYDPSELERDNPDYFYAICIHPNLESPVFRITGGHIDEFQTDIIALYKIVQAYDMSPLEFINRINNL